MLKTPKGMRLHIGIFGKRNVGKSSLINALTEQEISIVSDIAGTTTDVVEKSMELLPLGPVTFLDTAGIDDTGKIGNQRIEKTKKIFDRTDLALIILNKTFDNFEKDLINEFETRKTPYIFVINKSDKNDFNEKKLEKYKKDIIKVSATQNNGIEELKSLIIKNAPDNYFKNDKIIGDILKKGDTAILVIPIDKEAPAGRLILPQVQTIRNLLDFDIHTFITKETDLKEALNKLKTPPKIVITDSQAFKKVSDIVPENILLTSFSIIFARLKGDLKEFVKSAHKIKNLKDGDKVLFCESCTHQTVADDIARVKIPKMLTKSTGKELNFEYYTGHDFPVNIKDYSLIIHCGACMTNKKEILSRQLKAKQANVPMTNYGITIAYCLNILDRAIKPFNISASKSRFRSRTPCGSAGRS